MEYQINRRLGHSQILRCYMLLEQQEKYKNRKEACFMEKHMNTPLTKDKIADLAAGDYVYLTGTIYTARDAAHKKMYEALEQGIELPFDLTDNTIYYLGPSPARPGQIIGSAGPTTSSRMDKYTPALLDRGLGGMIGKGKRCTQVIESMIKNHCVYMAAIGGAGALLSKCIQSAEVIAYAELGTEAVRKLYVKELPVIVVIDSQGNNLYDIAAQQYRRISAC